MAVLTAELESAQPPEELPFRNGDRLDQPTFHALYEQTPDGFRAELIGGIVFMGSPVGARHAITTSHVHWWLVSYRARTFGVTTTGEATVILGFEDELQPDATLLIDTECGGATRRERGCLAGTPEMVLEVAHSTVAIDLHRKKDRYEEAGVREYLVFLEAEHKVCWFVSDEGRFVQLSPDDDGVLRSRQFPGLWLDPVAFWSTDYQRLQEVLEQGCATPEHAEFVARLEAARAAGV